MKPKTRYVLLVLALMSFCAVIALWKQADFAVSRKHEIGSASTIGKGIRRGATQIEVPLDYQPSRTERLGASTESEVPGAGIEKENEFWNKRGYIVEEVAPFVIDARAQKIYLQLYFDLFGAFPAGDTTSIVRALCGANAKQLNLFPPTLGDPEQMFRDSFGNLVALRLGKTRNDIQIRSAGPNRVFMDGDDKVIGPFEPAR